jgi:hypothetical protein
MTDWLLWITTDGILSSRYCPCAATRDPSSQRKSSKSEIKTFGYYCVACHVESSRISAWARIEFCQRILRSCRKALHHFWRRKERIQKRLFGRWVGTFVPRSSRGEVSPEGDRNTRPIRTLIGKTWGNSVALCLSVDRFNICRHLRCLHHRRLTLTL